MRMHAAWPLLALLLLAVVSCSHQEYQCGWYEVLPTTSQGTAHLKFLLAGLGLTISISVISLIASISVGLLVALPGLTRQRWLRAFNRLYVEVFRSIPVLVMILWVYYGLPASGDLYGSGGRIPAVDPDCLLDGAAYRGSAANPRDLIRVSSPLL